MDPETTEESLQHREELLQERIKEFRDHVIITNQGIVERALMISADLSRREKELSDIKNMDSSLFQLSMDNLALAEELKHMNCTVEMYKESWKNSLNENKELMKTLTNITAKYDKYLQGFEINTIEPKRKKRKYTSS